MPAPNASSQQTSMPEWMRDACQPQDARTTDMQEVKELLRDLIDEVRGTRSSMLVIGQQAMSEFRKLRA